ncbi:MAG: sugar transferase [Clostridia bacterium]
MSTTNISASEVSEESKVETIKSVISHDDYKKIKKPSISKLFLKRVFDICSSAVAILILLPFFLFFTPIVAIIMKGNPFFVQKRVGKNGKIFNILKYRTMTNGKDKEGNLLPDKDRLTKLGKFLRATSIDELPELLNIFTGQMSVVGPRPLLRVYFPFYSAEQLQRHMVRPGLTGLAQISGRNNITWEQKIEYDLEYINKLNFLYDLKIIFMTIAKVLKKDDVVVQGSSQIKEFYDEWVLPENLMEKEIGSSFVFGAENKGNGLRVVTDKKNLTLVNSGRNAIKVVLQQEKVKKAFIPIFTCESVIKAFVDEGIEIEYYDVDKQLNIKKGLYKKISLQKNKSIVYLQNYFCSYNLDGVKKKLKKYKNVVVVEDITHSMLDNRKFVNADYYVGSIRKWAGVWEGGIVFSNSDIVIETASDNCLVDKLTNVAALQKEYYLNGKLEIKKIFREKLSDIEHIFDFKETQSIAQQTKQLMECVDFENIAKIRKENYYNLGLMLTEFNVVKPIFEIDVGKSVPLYFPVYADDREKLQKYFCENKIYCPIIWPKSNFAVENCNSEADYIYKHILCFPIDQRYNIDDMKKIFKVLEEYSKG